MTRRRPKKVLRGFPGETSARRLNDAQNPSGESRLTRAEIKELYESATTMTIDDIGILAGGISRQRVEQIAFAEGASPRGRRFLAHVPLATPSTLRSAILNSSSLAEASRQLTWNPTMTVRCLREMQLYPAARRLWRMRRRLKQRAVVIERLHEIMQRAGGPENLACHSKGAAGSLQSEFWTIYTMARRYRLARSRAGLFALIGVSVTDGRITRWQRRRAHDSTIG